MTLLLALAIYLSIGVILTERSSAQLRKVGDFDNESAIAILYTKTMLILFWLPLARAAIKEFRLRRMGRNLKSRMKEGDRQ